jgi:hypothetical protein
MSRGSTFFVRLAIVCALVFTFVLGLNASTSSASDPQQTQDASKPARQPLDRPSGRVSAASGMTTADLTTGLTAQSLANALVGGTGVTISNVTSTGAQRALGTFAGGSSIIGIDSGIILSTGDIRDVIGPNLTDGTGSTNGTAGDASLNALIPGFSTFDAATLEFDFVPQGNSISFQYVFGSEEYNEYVGSTFNDVFGFFVNGANVAVVPGTTPPVPVSINNVNGGCAVNCQGTDTSPHNPQFYRNNDPSDGTPTIDTEMDGVTTVLSINAAVNPGVTNHIKLAIADAGDSVLDSNVFIKAGSFTSGCARTRLNPSTPNVGVGATFTMAVVVDAPTCNVSRADAFFNFDPTKLQVVDSVSGTAGVQIAPGTALTQVLQNGVNNATGAIDFSAQLPSAPFPTGTFTIATITFQALALTGAGGTPVSFVFGGARTTNIFLNTTSVFGGATDGQVLVTTNPPTTVPTPSPTQGGGGGGALGGRGFTLTTKASPLSVVLTWQGGNQQDSYFLLKVPLSGGQQVLSTLAGSDTSFTDIAVTPGGFYCYFLVPKNGANILGVSDPLCAITQGSPLATTASTGASSVALQQGRQLFEGAPPLR